MRGKPVFGQSKMAVIQSKQYFEASALKLDLNPDSILINFATLSKIFHFSLSLLICKLDLIKVNYFLGW